jgi:hypothetical protein
VKEVEAFIRETIPATDLEMIVSEIGLNPDWSAAYTTNAGQQDAIIRMQLKGRRAHSAQEYAAMLRQAFNARPAFNDLRADFDTGGMISTALNMGSSSPIDIEVGRPMCGCSSATMPLIWCWMWTGRRPRSWDSPPRM